MSSHTHTGTVVRMVKLTHTVNGNPRWRVTWDDGRVMNTKPDSTVGYEMDVTWAGLTVTAEMNGRGQIVSAVRHPF